MTGTAVPCEPWDVIWCDECDISSTSPVVTGFAVQGATEVLWGLSGRQFGLCTIENLRPCRRTCPELFNYGAPFPQWMGSWTYPQPALLGGQWFNLTCGTCAGECSCSKVSEFILPGPVDHIVQIVIDGTVLPTGSYRVDNQDIVIRTDGGDWPICNDIGITSGVGAWSVDAVFGQAPPSLAALAVGELAMEIIKGCSPDSSGCKLPTRFMTALARQGVNMSFADPQVWLENDLLGLDICDLFIRTFNPHGLSMRSRMYSPDRLPVRRAGT